MGFRFSSSRWLRAFTCSAALLGLSAPLEAHIPGEPLGAIAPLGDGWIATNYGLLGEAPNGTGWRWTPEEILDRAIYVWTVESGGSRVWVGTDDGVWRTGDGGCSWERAGLVGVGVRALVWRDGALYAGGESASGAGGLFVLEPEGATFSPIGLNDGPQIAGLVVADDGRVRACGHDPAAAGQFRLWEDNTPRESDARALLGTTSDALLLLNDQRGLVAFDSDGLSSPVPLLAGDEPIRATLNAAGEWLVLHDDGSVRRHSEIGDWRTVEVPPVGALGRSGGDVFFGFDTTASAFHLRWDGADIARFDDVSPRVCENAAGKALVTTLWPVITNLGVGARPPAPTPPAVDGGCRSAPSSWPWGPWLVLLSMLLRRVRPSA